MLQPCALRWTRPRAGWCQKPECIAVRVADNVIFRVASRIVIADAGPLIALARIELLDLLPGLFGQVTITTQIANELLGGGSFPDSPLLTAALFQPWLATIDLKDLLADAVVERCSEWMNLYQIDLGEASAMVLAKLRQTQGSAPLLVIDDHRGRSAAQHAGLAVIGTTGLLLLAKRSNLVNEIRPLLLALRQSGYFLSARLIDAALRQAEQLDEELR